jgi:hypothetical protein
MICGDECKRRSKVFAGGKKFFACRECVLKLVTHELVFCEACRTYQFHRKRALEGPNGRRAQLTEG